MSTLVPGPTTDQSVYFLWQIFGNIIYWISGENVPSGGDDPTIIHYVISAFNSGLMSVLFVIYAIVLFIGTLNTAHQGEFLGRNWSSMWAPLRAAFGPLCMIPVKYGFCLIQIVLLYAVLVGVQLANFVWNSLEVELGQTAIPAVPVSLLNDVKTDVSKAVLYEAVQKVADDLDVSTSKLTGNTLNAGGTCATTDSSGQATSNQFYNIDGTPTFCVNTEATLPQIDAPSLVSSVNALCDNSDFMNEFAQEMNLFYQSPYSYNGQTITHPGNPYLSSGILTQQCVNSMTLLLSNQNSGSNISEYTFPVSGYSQQLAFKASLGDGSSSSSGGAIYVSAAGNIAFNFSNQNYANGSENSYSRKAERATNQIVTYLYNDDLNLANRELNNYINDLNKDLLGSIQSSSSSTPKGIADSAESSSGSDGPSYYDQCKHYLSSSDDDGVSDDGDDANSSGSLNLRYLECLQLEESNQTYSLSDHVDSDYPFKSYIDSWWMGG
ncbi:DotA/TraY family protein [Piscirickettsia litoralis]|uniref:Uncharacterized protein n=1 Tax=Piscirickettsia litoralis TaxID=1891921 RepID=A0ABX3A1V9_9GAMM|nr:DotA/TraY family protein [Piscirickettsia litoralis]ODN42480.1 hypothetical protein BGC07_05485 [Piscirickettsia litoralis]